MTKYGKLLCGALISLSSATGFSIDQNDLPGVYNLEHTSCPDLYTSKLEIKSDGTYTYSDTTLEGKPSVCKGNYHFDGELLYGMLYCPSSGIQQIVKQYINFSDLTLRDLTSGSQINIKSDLYKCAKEGIVRFNITKKARVRVIRTHPSYLKNKDC